MDKTYQKFMMSHRLSEETVKYWVSMTRMLYILAALPYSFIGAYLVIFKKNKTFVVCFFLAIEMFYLVISYWPELILITNYLLLLIIALIWLSNLIVLKVRPDLNSGHLITLLVISYGAIIGVEKIGIINTALGLRIYIYPFVMATILRKASTDSLVRILKFIGYSIFVNALACVIEILIGVNQLLKLFPNLTYGLNIRQIGNNLRAPGLMRSNVYIGLTAACFLIVITYLRSNSNFINRFPHKMYTIASTVCIILSTARVAYLVAVVGVLIASSKLNLSSKMVTRLGISIIFVILLLQNFALQISSVKARPIFWNDIFKQLSLVGNGIGSIGGATSSRYSNAQSFQYTLATSKTTFADNYYLSLIYQFGWIFGIILIMGVILSVLIKIRKNTGVLKNYLFALTISIFLACFFLDFGEYSICIYCLILGYEIIYRQESSKKK